MIGSVVLIVRRTQLYQVSYLGVSFAADTQITEWGREDSALIQLPPLATLAFKLET
jgi:hypothetical protein